MSPDGTAEGGFTRLRMRLEGGAEQVVEARLDGDRLRLRVGGRVVDLWLEAPSAARPHEEYLELRGERIAVELRRGSLALGGTGPEGSGRVSVSSPMPGRIVAVPVAVGDRVAKGDLLFTLEAMKMQNEFTAPAAGRIAALLAAPGKVAAAGEVLAEIEPDSTTP